MAATTEAALPLSTSTHRPMANTAHRGSSNTENTRGVRGGRGRGRGPRGGPRENDGGGNPYYPRQNNRDTTNSSILPAPSLPPPPGPGGRGSFGGRLTEDAKIGEGEVGPVIAGASEGDEAGVEVEVCFICASPVVHNAVAPCNHRTCHICALRMRALYKNRQCAHCRTEAKYIIFTDDPSKRYEDFEKEDFEQTDEIQGIKYEKKDIYDDTILLLRYNCPDSSCDVTCWSLRNLQGHVKSVHHKFMCELCTKNKKVFMHEHELFTAQELRKHEKFGDDNPGAVDQSGFKGHPDCGFCQQRFYGDDELYVHCREQHERCHICDRRQHGGKQQYYVNYDSLEIHFREKHFLCADRECMEKKFVVFESEMDLKAHQLETHPQGLSKDARKDARRVDISSFDYRTPHQGSSRGGRRNRDDRGWRDPNAEPLPQSSAQPLGRAELAYQRQQAIQSAQSIAPRTFGGQLTQNPASSGPACAARPRNQEPPTITAPRSYTSTNPSFPPLDNLSLNPTSQTPDNLSAPGSPSLSQALTPQEQARRIHHTSVMNRASDMLKANPSKTTEFRAQVSSYRQSSITAQQLIDSFIPLFDAPTSELGKLLKELADIYESEAKRNELLKAWNDWKAVNEDYPSLPGPSGIVPSDAQPTSGGRRILKLKSSTAQSSRSAVSKQGSWGSSGPSGSSSPFPPIVSGASTSANRAGAGKTGPVPWATASSSARPSPAPSRPTSAAPSRGTGMANDAFPALPAAQRLNTTMTGLHRGAVNWGNGGSKVQNAWGVANAATATASHGASGLKTPVGDVEDEFDGEGGGKKGKKAKKTTLYKFG